MSRKGNIFTVHTGEPLAEVSARYITDCINPKDPLSITDVTIWVPSPRAALALKDAFMRKTNAGLLPQIKMMSFSEDDADVFRFEQDELVTESVVTGLARLMILTKITLAKERDLSFPLALENATALAKVFHRLKSYDVTLDDISALVPPELSHHWESNLEFFKIAFYFYPKWLKEEGKVDAADASKKVVQAQINDYKNGMAKLTFAVGFSDSTPLGVSLLKEVIAHEKGALILPGLDKDMKDDVWESLKSTHPNYTMKRMLVDLNVKRSDVKNLENEQISDRAKLWRYALAPSDQLSLLPDSFTLPATAGITLVEAKNASEEAEAIACIMRQALEKEGKTCALVSPDRSLALRVETALKRWGVDVDDSAGVPLMSTSIGGLFKLVADVLDGRFSPLLLAELLYHPLVCLGEHEGFYKKRDVLDKLVLRGAKPSPGFAGLRRAFENALDDEYKEKENAEWALEALDILENIFAPLRLKNAERNIDFWIKNHIAVTERLLHREEDDGLHIFDDEAGQTLIALLTSWQNAAEDVGTMTFASYTETLNSVMSSSAVRKRHSTHPRLAIWGPMESRMQEVDKIILGAVNEGAWPRQVTPDPWLNKVIAEKLGIPSTDIHVGMSAHDFMSLASKENVVLTRTLKDSEGETMPSRFLSRLEAVISKDVYSAMKEKGNLWLNRVNSLRTEGEFVKNDTPNVTVKNKRRPHVWSASTVRDMMQCPYKIYVSKILKIEGLEPYESKPTAADKGQIIHKILESFFVAVPKMPTPYTGDMQNEKLMCEHLMLLAKHAFEQVDQQGVKALWKRKFENIAAAFAAQIASDYKEGRKLFAVEKQAKVNITASVKLHARADRLDKTVDNKLVVLDYKTGKPPSVADVMSGKEPQMATEAVIASKQGYDEHSKLIDLEYWQVSGAKNNPVDVKSALGKKGDISVFIEEAEVGIRNLASTYTEHEKEYEAFPGGMTAEDKEGPCVFCDYAGICRYKDWV